MKVLDIIVAVLLIVGGLNWGLIGFFDFNLLGTLFGETALFTRVLYGLVGIGALYEVFGITFGYKATHDRWCETGMATVKH